MRAYVSVLIGGVTDFKTEPGGALQAAYDTVQGENGSVRYIIHVTQHNGLAYDVKVHVSEGTGQVKITEKIRDLRDRMSVFDSHEKIAEIQAQLAEVEGQTVDSEERYYEIMEALGTLEGKVYELNDGLEIYNASAENYLYDYWDNSRKDEEGYKYVLYLERKEDVTDQAVLEKLQLEFSEELVSVVIETSDSEGYQALIKATNPNTGLVKNIYVKITEY